MTLIVHSYGSQHQQLQWYLSFCRIKYLCVLREDPARRFWVPFPSCSTPSPTMLLPYPHPTLPCPRMSPACLPMPRSLHHHPDIRASAKWQSTSTEPTLADNQPALMHCRCWTGTRGYKHALWPVCNTPQQHCTSGKPLELG